MRDYTEFFAEAIRKSAGYDAERACSVLNGHDAILCTDEIDCLDENFLFLYETDGWNPGALYGYLSMRFPAALLTAQCPAAVIAVLDQLHILHTDLEESMCCDPEILKQYAPQERYHIFNEDLLLAGDYSEDDERFRLVLYRLETGRKCYVDAGDFMFCEINE